ncbi:MAG: hypothetical protein BWY98_00651 [Tenericutes bacterium ADurb.BinA155]|nr:MAG: hypothetical protein BWY98_00651 [Tenericutes bacterium ADurb.BinA155]
MGNKEGCVIFGKAQILLIHRLLAKRIKGSGRLIEQKNRRAFIKGTGQHQLLGFASGEANAREIEGLSDVGIFFLRKTLDFFLEASLAHRRPKSREVAFFFIGAGHVIEHGEGERLAILEYRGDQSEIIIAGEFLGVDAIDEDTAGGGGV